MAETNEAVLVYDEARHKVARWLVKASTLLVQRDSDWVELRDRVRSWARMHHKVVGNFGSEADVRSLYFRGFRFNETSDNGACTHGQLVK